MRRNQEIVNEVQATLDWATVRSPMDGVVIDKQVDVGDTVTPGQVLVTIFDPKRMQLVASVRESLALQLRPGQEIDVQVHGLDKQCSGTISEIVPEAQAASRAFQVKVTGPCPTGIYTGMFGRILIPLAEEEILVIPQTIRPQRRPIGTGGRGGRGPRQPAGDPHGTEARRRRGDPVRIARGRAGPRFAGVGSCLTEATRAARIV